MSTEAASLTPAEPRSLMRLWLCVVLGAALWLMPPPEGLSPQGWQVFAVFSATIVSFLLRPLPMGACVLVGLLVLACTGSLVPQLVLDPQEQNGAVSANAESPAGVVENSLSDRIAGSFKGTLKGFANTTVWLVVAAFLISGAMVHSGLGRRVALMMTAALGRTTLGLGYAIAGAELLLAPFIPSNTARGGGLMMPIVNSICGVLGSEPHRHPRRAGEYLALCGAHINLVTAAMFMTGMAANPLVAVAAENHFAIDFSWGTWLLGSIVPGLLSLALLPLLLYKLAPPELADARDAQGLVRTQLKELGNWAPQQIVMATVLGLMLVIWATGPLQSAYWGVQFPTSLVALIGVATLVVLGILPYEHVKGNAAAWDTLLWLGGLVTMADALKTTGFVDWFAAEVQSTIGTTTGLAAAVLLALVYFYSMYAFSMLTGHVLAFVGVFFTVAEAVEAPSMVIVALLAYFSNLCGCTTNYSTGPVVIYSSLGFVSTARWFRIGFIVSLFHLAVWLGVGLLWWKFLGWW